MDTPVWRLLTTGAPAAVVRAAVKADPGVAAQPFVTPASWRPTEGAAVRLRPGLPEKHGLRAGEVATVTETKRNGDIELKRQRDGKELGSWPNVFKPAHLVHRFDGWLPVAAAIALQSPDDTVMVLVEAAPDALGADRRTPLHLAVAAGRSMALLQRMIAQRPTWVTSLDADVKSPFQLLAHDASEEANRLLRTGYGHAGQSLWGILDATNRVAPSAVEVRAAVKEEPAAAAQPFATPGGWTPTAGAVVRLRPGLDEKKSLRAGEVAMVTWMARDGDIKGKRLRDGKECGSFKLADLVHAFDGWLPVAAAIALKIPDDAVMVLTVAARDAVGADGRSPLHLAAAADRSVELIRRMLAMPPTWAIRLNKSGKTPFQRLPTGARQRLLQLSPGWGLRWAKRCDADGKRPCELLPPDSDGKRALLSEATAPLLRTLRTYECR